MTPCYPSNPLFKDVMGLGILWLKQLPHWLTPGALCSQDSHAQALQLGPFLASTTPNNTRQC